MSELNNIPKHWQVKKLGEVCQFTQGIQIDINKQKDYQFENSVRFLRIIDFTQTSEPPRYIENPGDRYLLKKGEIAMVRYGTVGFVCIGKEGAIANNLFKINHNQEINSKYLINFLQSLLFLSKLETKGATMQALSFGLIKPIQIPIPPLPEQLAIVSKIEELLSDLENGKQQLLTAQQQLKVYRQSLLKVAFEGKNLIPFEEFIDSSQNGFSKRIGTNGIDYKVLRLADISNNSINESSPRKIIMDESEIVRYKLHKDDLLCIRVNGSKELVGKLIYVSSKNENEKWSFCDHFIRFRLNSQKAFSKYFHYYFSTLSIRKYIHDNMVTSAGQNTVSQGTIKNAFVPFCSIEEQQQIVEILESKLTVCDKIEETISQSLLQAETLKKSILKKAFEGKLVP